MTNESDCKMQIAKCKLQNEIRTVSSRQPPGPGRGPRPAFTLFELILAIALSATLLALIGTAINLYLLRVDAGRTRVEEAQLARSILATIAADVRAASTYQTQDVSAIAELASAVAQFDVDDLDEEGDFQGGAIGSSGTASTVGTATSVGSSSGTTSLHDSSVGGR